jgi:glycerol-3-phosphate acyltransferase PlsY
VYRALLVFAAYLAGTFPTARLVVDDVQRRGSGNPGASNAFRLEGRRAGATVLLGDALKGAVAAAIPLLAQLGRPLALVCGAAAVVGHCFPLPRPTRGGKGVATGAGMAAVLFPAEAAVAALTWFGVARLTGRASVASLAAVATVLMGTAVSGRPVWEVTAVAGVAMLIILRHTRNLRDLRRGEERTLR